MGTVSFLAPLAGSSMADGGSVLIHLGDHADVSWPISNSCASPPPPPETISRPQRTPSANSCAAPFPSAVFGMHASRRRYAAHPVTASTGCTTLCTQLLANPTADMWGGPTCASWCAARCQTEQCTHADCQGCNKPRGVDASRCMLKHKAEIRAAPGFGPITVNGFGRVNGQKVRALMMADDC